MSKKTSKPGSKDNAKRDLLSVVPGSHLVGPGVGAAVGGVAVGAAAGTLAGPVGTAVGAAAGALLGGLAGNQIEAIDPSVEDAYWRDNFALRPYVENGAKYDDYGPAYVYGVSAFARYPGRAFDEIETELGRGWKDHRGASRLDWDRAKQAARDAWQRLSDAAERASPADSSRDGK